MSVDIDWPGFTTGESGQKLAESVRDFVDDKFQQIPLPHFLRDVRVQSFAFGSQCPSVELKDISDPWREFYEDSDDDEQPKPKPPPSEPKEDKQAPLSRNVSTGYFQMPLGVGLSGSHSGSTTPFSPAWSLSNHDFGWNTHQSALAHLGFPWSHPVDSSRSDETDVISKTSTVPAPLDLQTTLHVSYSGDVSLTLTAEILLNYPMPSFVGIPFKLIITGLDFEGVALLVYLSSQEQEPSRGSAKFCFLDQEASRLLSDKPALGGSPLKDIRVQSEIGRQTGHVLKNVDKVEHFIVEQIRRIFEEELVFPSFYTFLL